MPNLPKLHPRHRATTNARSEFARFLLELERKYELTPSETFLLLSAASQRLASICVKSEREGEP